MFTRLTARQLRKPDGLLGRYAGRTMNRLNEQMNREAIARLECASQHQVLDIGFGGGTSLALLAAQVEQGQVHGVELSDTMLSAARRRFDRVIKAGRMAITAGSIGELPYATASFDRVCTINTVYFWPSLEAGLMEVHRVLREDGRFVLCYRPAEVMSALPFTRHEFELFTVDQIEAALAAHGFRSLGHTFARDAHLAYACVAAEKADAHAQGSLALGPSPPPGDQRCTP